MLRPPSILPLRKIFGPHMTKQDLSPLPKGRQSRPTEKVIDVHGHLGVPAVEKMVGNMPERQAEMQAMAVASGEISMAYNFQEMLPRAVERFASLDKRLQDMDYAGIDVQVVSPSPHLYCYWADKTLAGEIVSASNEAALDLVARAPDRLVGLGIISLQHPELAAEQLRAAIASGLKGVEISASVNDVELSNPVLDQIWQIADDTKAVIFIHPLGSSLGARLDQYYLSNIVGQPIETAIALSHLIFGGVLDRFPNIRFVGAHGGGYLPSYIGRSDHAWRVRPESQNCTNLPSSYLRRIWFDTIVFGSSGVRNLVSQAGADRVMFGTDYPFDMGDYNPQAVGDSIADDDDRAKVLGETAAALFSL